MKRQYEEKDGIERKQRTAKRHASGYSAEFKGYVNLNLTPELKETYDAWASSASFWEYLQSSVEDGINLSLKLDPKSEGYLASATQRREDSPNAGLVVTARAGDAAKALGRVLFCLAILSRKPRWVDTQPVSDPDRW